MEGLEEAVHPGSGCASVSAQVCLICPLSGVCSQIHHAWVPMIPGLGRSSTHPCGYKERAKFPCTASSLQSTCLITYLPTVMSKGGSKRTLQSGAHSALSSYRQVEARGPAPTECLLHMRHLSSTN